VRAVLTYHSIDDSGSAISVSREAFDQHVRWLTSGRVRVVPLTELAAAPAEEDAVALTFDDAFANFATEAAPRLITNGLPATLFVVSDRIGTTNAWDGRPVRGIPTLPLLDWPMLERLCAAGVTLGAHTRTHPDLTALDEPALDDEIVGCAERLRQRTGGVVAAFAYPYGRVNSAVARRVATAFALGCTTDFRALRSTEVAALLPRLDMYYFQRPGLLENWGSDRFKRMIAVRRRLRRLRLSFDRLSSAARAKLSPSARQSAAAIRSKPAV